MKAKEELRQHCLELLKKMDAHQKFSEQVELEHQMLALLDSKPRVVSIYISQVWELSTHKFIEKALQKGVQVACPRVTGPGELRHFKIEGLSECEVSKWGILEPKALENNEVEAQDFDMIFVPGLAFSIAGQRLGYGGGYYDRFLSQTKGDKIGLSFRNQLFSELPMENHDIQLDKVLHAKPRHV